MRVSLRKANQKDWDFILELRNSFFKFFLKQKAPIEKKEHYKYMKTQSKNKNFHHWIVLYKNQKAGYVRLLNFDVGIMIKKEFQNKGLATAALLLLEQKAREFGLKKLEADVLIYNKSSKKIFLKNDYKVTSYRLEKNIT